MVKGKDLKPHIGIFGRRNNGKSSFINALVGQEVAIVSDHAGTTTDPVKKSVEIFGVGPAIIIDTAGIDDHGELGLKRVNKTLETIKNVDLAILLITQNEFDEDEIDLLKLFQKLEIPSIIIHSKADLAEISNETVQKIKTFTISEVLEFSIQRKEAKEEIIDAIRRNIPESVYQKPSLFKGLLKTKDLVLLVTPIDSEAPDGRMILPQVMAWRDVLDHDAICMSVKETELEDFMKLGLKPNLVVTDSQVFDYVASVLPEDMLLTSFSILFARLKGDFKTYIDGARQIDKLKDGDKILIMESCSHQLSCDDIGQYKIPRWLKSYTKKDLHFDFLSGLNEDADNLNAYALVIQCGGCVATHKQIVNRIRTVREEDIPMTNYGLAIAYLNGIFERVIQLLKMGAASFNDLLNKDVFEKKDVLRMLKALDSEQVELFEFASRIKQKHVGDKVYLRGLVEFSNICKKDCLYCGIRSSNKNFKRYEVDSNDIAKACDFAIKNNFGSMVIQSGELQSEQFTEKILNAIRLIKEKSNGKMRITLSCGEQSEAVYQKWFDAGAERYLLRIEASNPDLYQKIHPNNQIHSYASRISSLKKIKEIGFQTGTGVMIGLPFQTLDDLANDILFMRDFDIDMCGMGPYIGHEYTPLFEQERNLLSLKNRYQLALKMIAVLRIVMKDVNIASTTALQAIDSSGKESALEIGANVIMPNLTPAKYKSEYHLYKDKPGKDLNVLSEFTYAIETIEKANCVVGFGEPGDAVHFSNR